jgi:anti-anti-sigma factor
VTGPASFELRAIRDGDSVALVVAGELDLATIPLLLAALERDTGAPTGTVLIDLAGVTFIGSTALRELLRIHDRLGERLRIAPGVAARRLFESTGTAHLLPLVEPEP